jgi:predicted nucleic acid-binding protein
VLESARKHITKLFPTHLEEFEKLLRLLPYITIPDPSVEEVKQNLNLLRDESDIPVALSAIHGKADILVSADKDFTDVDETTELLRSKITIMKPGSFLKEVIGLTSEDLDKLSMQNQST